MKGTRSTLENPVILELLPQYIHNLEDYLSLTSVSRTIRTGIQDNTSPHQHLHLAYASRRIFFRPSSLFLLTHLTRALFQWASDSHDNLKRMIESFWHGEEAVLALAISLPQVARLSKWTRHKSRQLWEWRMRVVKPLSDLIDECIGSQWQATDNFWDLEDAYTLEAEPEELVFRLIMYGEAFGDTWKEWYFKDNGTEDDETPPVLPPHQSLATRLEFLKYLFPDWHTPLSPDMNLRRQIDSDRDIRDDEYVYIRPLATNDGRVDAVAASVLQNSDIDDSSTSSQTLAPTNSAVTSTAHVRKTHPLRDCRLDIGPFADYWNGTELAQRTRLPEHISCTHRLLVHSTRWDQLTRNVFDQILDITNLSYGMDPTSIRLDTHLPEPSDDSTATYTDSWRFLEATNCLREALWMFGLDGAEYLAAHRRHTSRKLTRPVETTAVAFWSDNYWGGPESLISLDDTHGRSGGVTYNPIQRVVLEIARIILRYEDDKGPAIVHIGQRVCSETPSLEAECGVLLSNG